jgi:uncharacterized protein YggE
MKRALTATVVVSAVIVGLVLLASCGATDDESDTGASTDERIINVSGIGSVSLPPDIVMLSLGVDITRPDLASAQAEATNTMNAVIESLTSRGVAEEDIQTATYAIYLERDYSKADQPLVGYHVTHTVTAKVREIGRAGEIIQAAVDAGANTVQNVWFALDDATAAVRQARELAVADARSKAAELARLSGVELGALQTISESISAPIVGTRDTAVPGEGSGAPTINPGQTEVVVSVTATYAIE